MKKKQKAAGPFSRLKAWWNTPNPNETEMDRQFSQGCWTLVLAGLAVFAFVTFMIVTVVKVWMK